MDKIRDFVNSLNYEDYESKEEMIDTITCELIETAADYDRVSAMVLKALDEREAREKAKKEDKKMYITDEQVLDQLKKEWKKIDRIIERRPDMCTYFVNNFHAVCEFAEKLTGKRYTVVECDGVIEY